MKTITVRVNGRDICAIEVDDDVYEEQMRSIRRDPSVALTLARIAYTAMNIERQDGRLGPEDVPTFDGRAV